jgi:hypothetical protein
LHRAGIIHRAARAGRAVREAASRSMTVHDPLRASFFAESGL